MINHKFEDLRLNNRAYWAWIMSLKVEGFKNSNIRRLLRSYENPEEVFFYANGNSGDFSFLSEKQKDILLNNATDDAVDRAVQKLMENKIKIIPNDDPDYPQILTNLHSPPLCLYVKGRIKASRKDWIMSIVGTRRCSNYGKKISFDLAHDLANMGACIVSGLAYGIDKAAHEGALSSGKAAATIAVFPCGLDIIYPQEHEKLAEEIVANGGALISELPPNSRVVRHYIPHRNRIISALGDGLIVVEAPHKSGVQHTVSVTLDLGKDIFAVPGQVDSLNSQLCNQLIKDGAKMLNDVRDIYEHYRGLMPNSFFDDLDLKASYNSSRLQKEKNIFIKNAEKTAERKNIEEHSEENNEKSEWNFSDEEAIVVAQIGYQARSVEELVPCCGISVPQLLCILTSLMEKGAIEQSEAGNRFILR